MSTARHRVPLRTVALMLCALWLAACTPTPEELRTRAEAALKGGDSATALVHLKAYVEQRPQDAAARVALGRVALMLGDAPAAEKEFRRALKLGAPPDTLTPMVVEALLTQNRFAEALSELGPAAKGDIRDARLLMLAGRCYAGLGRMADAEARYRAAMAVAPDLSPPRLALAEVLMATGRGAEADALIDSVLKTDPKTVPARVLRGKRMAELHGWQPAATWLEQTLTGAKSARDRFDVLVNLADAYLGLEDLAAADRAITDLEAIAGPAVLTRYLRARWMAQREDYAGAVASLQGILNQAPDFLPAERLLGTVQYLNGNLEQATVHIARVLNRGGQEPFLARMLAELRLQQNRPDQALQTLLPVLRQGPGAVFDQRLLVLAGQASLRLGDAQAAVSYFRRGVADHPEDERFRLGEISALLASGDVAGARARLDGLQASAAHRLAVDYLSVMAWLIEGNYPRAAELAGRLVEAHPQAAWSRQLLATVRLAQNRPAEARAGFEAVLEVEPANREALLNLARLDFQAGDLKNGELRLRRLIDADETDARPRLMLAEAQLAAGNSAAALDLARQLLRQDPDSAAAVNLLGRAAAAAGRWREAHDAFNRSTALDPGNARVWLNLTRAMLAAGRKSSAPENLQRALQLAPQDPAVLTAVGDLSLDLGQPREALAHYQRAWRLQPDADAVMRICRAAVAVDAKASCPLLDDWVKAHPADVPTRMFRASVHHARGASAEAMALYESVLAIEPRHPVALNNLAWMYFEQNDARAQAMAERALDVQPQAAAPMDTLGWIMLKNGDRVRALKLLESAAGLLPQDPDIGYHFAAALWENGERAKARDTLARVLSATPEFASRRAAQELMQRLDTQAAGVDG